MGRGVPKSRKQALYAQGLPKAHLDTSSRTVGNVPNKDWEHAVKNPPRSVFEPAWIAEYPLELLDTSGREIAPTAR